MATSKCKSVSGIENCINRQFLKDREGFEKKGYVPKDKQGNPLANSGVTIGNGIDLKSKNKKYFEDLGVPKSLIDKFEPYMNLTIKGQAAQDLLAKKPLTLNEDEVKQLQPVSDAVMSAEVKRIETSYNNEINRLNKGLKCFNMLTDAQRTVISSVFFQYGSPSGAPKFWGFVTNQDWAAAEKELRNFGDKHPSRRILEADLLKNDSGKNSSP